MGARDCMMGGTSYHELANRNPSPTIRPTATRSTPIVPDCLITSSSRACASGRRTYGSPAISGGRYGGCSAANIELWANTQLLEIADRFIVTGRVSCNRRYRFSTLVRNAVRTSTNAWAAATFWGLRERPMRPPVFLDHSVGAGDVGLGACKVLLRHHGSVP
jgi:hypothetical protein